MEKTIVLTQDEVDELLRAISNPCIVAITNARANREDTIIAERVTRLMSLWKKLTSND
jgi:hypothetical protein